MSLDGPTGTSRPYVGPVTKAAAVKTTPHATENRLHAAEVKQKAKTHNDHVKRCEANKGTAPGGQPKGGQSGGQGGGQGGGQRGSPAKLITNANGDVAKISPQAQGQARSGMGLPAHTPQPRVTGGTGSLSGGRGLSGGISGGVMGGGGTGGMGGGYSTGGGGANKNMTDCRR